MLPLALALACAPPADDVTTTTTTTTTTVEAIDAADADRIDAALDGLAASYASGAQLAIWLDGAIVYQASYGSAHPDQDVPITPDTLFQIGSDSKKLTAIALLREVEAGGAELDDVLSDVLPDLELAQAPGAVDAITLHQLLSHQTALYDYTPWDEAASDDELADRTYGRFADNEYAYGPAGTYWNYANPNFSLAGLAVETLAGAPFADVLQDELFPGLGLDKTYARLGDALAAGEDLAASYGLWFPDGWDTFDPFGTTPDYELRTILADEQIDNGWTRPAGLYWSTATDMALLGAFLVDGDPAVLGGDQHAALTSGQVQLIPAVPDQHYSYGLLVVDGLETGRGYWDTPIWAHGGNTMSMTSTFWVFPEQRMAISILSNGYGDAFTDAALTAARRLLELPEGEAPPVEGPRDDLSVYEGTWFDPHGLGELTLTWDGARLLVSIPTLDAMGAEVSPALTPAAQDLFYVYVDGQPYDLGFYDGAEGTPFRWMKNRQFGAERQEDPVQTLTARPFHLAPPTPWELARHDALLR